MKSSVSRLSLVTNASPLAVVVAGLCLTAGTAAAQDAASANTGAQTIGIQDIVVTAQRRSERLSQVPISVQAVTGDQLARSAVLDTRMLESISPSVNFTGGFNGSATSLSVRGVSSTSYEGGIQPSVALVVDGVPVARQNEFLFDFSDIERIEVLSGPQGTLFGKNSTGGVVSVVTKRPTDHFEGSIEGLATTDEEYSVRGIVNTPIASGIASRFSAFYRDQAPLVKNIGGVDGYGARSYGINGGLLFDFSPDANLLLRGGYSKTRSSYTPILLIVPNTGPLGVLQTQVIGVPIGRGNRVINQNGLPYDYQKNWNLTAELNWDISDQVSLVSVTGYRSAVEHAGTDADATPVGITEGKGFTPNPLSYPLMWLNFADGHVYDSLEYGSQEFRLDFKTDRVTAIAGFFLQTLREHRRSHLPLVLAASYAGITSVPPTTQFFSDSATNARLKNDTAGIFGDVTYKITSTVNVFAGLRYTVESLNVDYNRDDFFNPVVGSLDPITLVNNAPPVSTTQYSKGRTDRSVSGRAGVQWRPIDGQNYYLSYNRGYKGAAANISNAATAVDPLLSPEKGLAVELGMKQRFWDGRLSFDIALYHQVIKNIQQTSSRPNQLFTDLINAGELRSDGVEVNMAASPARGLKLTLGGAYTDARYHGGRYPCNPTDLATNSPKCDVNGIKSLTDEQAYGTPKYKITSAVDYDYDLDGPLTIAGRAAFNWQSSVQYQLGDDPLTREPKRGILNLSLGVRSDDDRFDVTLFVNNVTDKFYYNYLNHGDFFIGRSYGNIARDSRRYGGVRLKYTWG